MTTRARETVPEASASVPHGAAPGAWVVYDPYWDPVSSHTTEAKAREIAATTGCHVIFDVNGTLGRLRAANYGHWEDFERSFLGASP